MGGGREGRWGGGSRWGNLGWWGCEATDTQLPYDPGDTGHNLGWGGGAQAPVTSPCPPSGVRARARVRARVIELVEPVLVL